MDMLQESEFAEDAKSVNAQDAEWIPQFAKIVNSHQPSITILVYQDAQSEDGTPEKENAEDAHCSVTTVTRKENALSAEKDFLSKKDSASTSANQDTFNSKINVSNVKSNNAVSVIKLSIIVSSVMLDYMQKKSRTHGSVWRTVDKDTIHPKEDAYLVSTRTVLLAH
jgi:hypothetical protein